MGAIKHKKKVREFFQKTPIGSIQSLKKMIGEENTYIYLLLNKMVKSGELYRLTRGIYSTRNDPTLVVFCFKPAYLGLQEALSIHNLWEQETNVIIITSKIVREGMRRINGNNIILKRIPSQLFFGIEYKHYGDFYLPVSDIEKTFLDLIYFKQPLDKKLCSVFKKKIDRKKLKMYLQRYDSKFRKDVTHLLGSV